MVKLLKKEVWVILYTLDINYFKKQSIIYLIISILCLIIGIIYELLSHNVYSIYMQFALVIPLIFGFILSLIIYIVKPSKLPNHISINLYNAAIATITIFSFIKGVLDIYGTTNSLINVYIIVSIILILLSIITNLKK